MPKLFKTPIAIRKLFPKRDWGFSPSDNKIYLTFDDGPIPEVTTWILDFLKSKNIKATFFCVGENVERHPKIYQRLQEEGHAIGNHTQKHIKSINTDKTNYLSSIQTCAKNVDTSLFRPPYGRLPKTWEKDILPNYRIIMWSWLSYDYDSSVSIEKTLQKAEEQITSGDILVLHDNVKAFEKVKILLPELIEIIHSKGLKFDIITDKTK